MLFKRNFYWQLEFYLFSEKAIHSILTASESQRPLGMSHAMSKTSSTKRVAPDDKLKKRSSQISKELSDMVIYVQVSKINIYWNTTELRKRER